METQGMIKPAVMFVGSIGLTAKGMADFFNAGTSIFGFGTAVLGFCAGIYAVIWWRNKVKRQEREDKRDLNKPQ